MFYSEACNNDERENDEESEDEGGSVSNLPTVSLNKREYRKNMGILGNIGKMTKKVRMKED